MRCLPSILKKNVLRPSSCIFHHSSCLCTVEDSCFFLGSNLFWFFCVCCLSCDILEKRSQLEYASVELIRMPPLRSSVSTTPELWVINSGFHAFLRLCSCNGLLHGRSCCFLKGQRPPFRSSSQIQPEGWFWKKGPRLEFLLRDFSDRLCFGFPKWGPSSPSRVAYKPPCLRSFPVFSVFVPLCLVSIAGSVASRCNG
jgi:hypothetical protein